MDRDIKPMVYFIGNTHYDPVWLWTWDEALGEAYDQHFAVLLIV